MKGGRGLGAAVRTTPATTSGQVLSRPTAVTAWQGGGSGGHRPHPIVLLLQARGGCLRRGSHRCHGLEIGVIQGGRKGGMSTAGQDGAGRTAARENHGGGADGACGGLVSTMIPCVPRTVPPDYF
jgi:hypothetical protein